MVVNRRLSLQSVTTSVRTANLVFFVFSIFCTVIYHWWDMKALALSVTPFTILGAAITIFLGFRTNAAYGRWWEARTLWGGIINQSRTLVRQCLTFTSSKHVTSSELAPEDEPPTAFARNMAYLQMALVNATRAHLRKQDPHEAIAHFLNPEDRELMQGEQNVPSALLRLMGIRLRSAYRAGMMDSIQMTTIDGSLTDMTNLLGGCERIKNTPLPRQYDTIPQLAIYIYSALLPPGLVSTTGMWTPIISSLITFLFIAIDSIGSNIEDPFENCIHDVPMTAMCRTIEINLRQMIGEKELPRAIEPSHGILN